MKILLLLILFITPVMGQQVVQLQRLGDGQQRIDIANKNQSCNCADLGYNRQFDITHPRYNQTWTYNVIGTVQLTTTLKEYGNGDIVSFSSNTAFVGASIIESGSRVGYHIFDPPVDDSDGWWYLPERHNQPAKISGLSFCYNVSPTASNVSISGKLDRTGTALVTLTRASTGESRTVRTNTFGQFNFPDVEINDLYILSGGGRGFTIIDRSLFLTEDQPRIILTTN